VKPRIVQLVVRGSVLYGLDAAGDVWICSDAVASEQRIEWLLVPQRFNGPVPR
jgi:hypothetical protein